MTRKLELIFKNAANKTAKITIDEAREDIESNEIKEAMEDIIEKDVFTSNGGALVAIHGARVVETEIQEFDLL